MVEKLKYMMIIENEVYPEVKQSVQAALLLTSAIWWTVRGMTSLSDLLGPLMILKLQYRPNPVLA